MARIVRFHQTRAVSQTPPPPTPPRIRGVGDRRGPPLHGVQPAEREDRRHGVNSSGPAVSIPFRDAPPTWSRSGPASGRTTKNAGPRPVETAHTIGAPLRPAA